MHSRKSLYRINLLITTSILVLCLGNLNQSTAQDDGSRGIKPDYASVKVNPKRKKKPRRPITFKTRTPYKPTPAPAGTEFKQLGVTIWRVNQGNKSNKGDKRELVEVDSQQTLERLDTNASYTSGNRIHLDIVSPSDGYLYIVDQEQYSDGSFGPAKMIYPTTTTQNGTNMIKAWNVVQIPATKKEWSFNPRELKQGEVRKVQTAEVLTIIISVKPLVESSRISNKQLELINGEFEGWKAQAETKIQQFDMENTVGEVIKTSSKGTERDDTEVTNEEELDAQTIFQVAVKPEALILVPLTLKFEAPAVSAEKKKQ